MTFFERIIPNGSMSAKCAATEEVSEPEYNLISGKLIKPKPKLDYCGSARSAFRDDCGLMGRHWKPKNKNGLFLYLKRVGPK